MDIFSQNIDILIWPRAFAIPLNFTLVGGGNAIFPWVWGSDPWHGWFTSATPNLLRTPHTQGFHCFPWDSTSPFLTLRWQAQCSEHAQCPHSSCWALMIAMAVWCPEDGISQPLSLCSRSYILSAPFSAMFPEPCLRGSGICPSQRWALNSHSLSALQGAASLYTLTLTAKKLLIKAESSLCLWVKTQNVEGSLVACQFSKTIVVSVPRHLWSFQSYVCDPVQYQACISCCQVQTQPKSS